MKRQRAFTLVEILIVVAIIVILMAILFPAVGRARVVIKRARCLSNMHQVMLALHDYSAANGGTLPASYWGASPWGAQSPTDSWKTVNPYLSGQNYSVLECPADSGSSPGAESSYFTANGFSYLYNQSPNAISRVTGGGGGAGGGGILYQEEATSWEGLKTAINAKSIRDALNYDGVGPEDAAYAPDANVGDRDITKVEIDTKAIPQILSAVQSANRPGGFTISDLSAFSYAHVIQKVNWGTGAPSMMQNTPQWKWLDQLDMSGTGTQPLRAGQAGYDAGKWWTGNPWARKNYNYDYWRVASKKIAVLDADAMFGFATPAATDTCPQSGMGFWHQYPYVTVDPAGNTLQPAEWYVRIHAGFLDGHAAAINYHQYWYEGQPGWRWHCPIHGTGCPAITSKDHDYY